MIDVMMLSDLESDVDLEDLECRLYSQVFHSSISEEPENHVLDTNDPTFNKNRYFADKVAPISRNRSAVFSNQNSPAHNHVDTSNQNSIQNESPNLQFNALNEHLNKCNEEKLSRKAKRKLNILNKKQEQQRIIRAANIDAELFRNLNDVDRKKVIKYQKRQRYMERKRERKKLKKEQELIEKYNAEVAARVVDNVDDRLDSKIENDVISISGSEAEDCVAIHVPNDLITLSSDDEETKVKMEIIIEPSECSSDVMYIDPEIQEIINLDLDESLAEAIQTERKENCSTPESNNDFLITPAELNRAKEFTKPRTLADACETESSCSAISDTSTPMKNPMFSEIDFEAPSKNMFTESNLESFSNFITPKRKNIPKRIPSLLTPSEEFSPIQTKATSSYIKSVSDSSSESESECSKSLYLDKKKIVLPNLTPFDDDLYSDNEDPKVTAKKKRSKKKRSKSDTEIEVMEHAKNIQLTKLNTPKKKANKKGAKSDSEELSLVNKKRKSIEGRISETENDLNNDEKLARKKKKKDAMDVIEENNDQESASCKKKKKKDKDTAQSIILENNSEENVQEKNTADLETNLQNLNPVDENNEITKDSEDKLNRKKKKKDATDIIDESNDQETTISKKKKKKDKDANQGIIAESNPEENALRKTTENLETNQEGTKSVNSDNNEISKQKDALEEVIEETPSGKKKKKKDKDANQEVTIEENGMDESNNFDVIQEGSSQENSQMELEVSNEEPSKKKKKKGKETAELDKSMELQTPSNEPNDDNEVSEGEESQSITKKKKKSKDPTDLDKTEVEPFQSEPNNEDQSPRKKKKKRKDSDLNKTLEIEAPIEERNDEAQSKKKKKQNSEGGELPENEEIQSPRKKIKCQEEVIIKPSTDPPLQEPTISCTLKMEAVSPSTKGRSEPSMLLEKALMLAKPSTNNPHEIDVIDLDSEDGEVPNEDDDDIQIVYDQKSDFITVDITGDSDDDDAVLLVNEDVNDKISSVDSDSVHSFSALDGDLNTDISLVNLTDSVIEVEKQTEESGSRRSRFSDFYTDDMKKFYGSWGLDNFDVENVQKTQTDDPSSWKIAERDRVHIQLRRGRGIGPFCRNCRDYGHTKNFCPKATGAPKCSLCGNRGHREPRCPNKICTGCGNKSGFETTYCSKCFNWRYKKCTVCRMPGHPENVCPDLWRRYHLTTEEGPIVKSKNKGPKKKRWCCGCGGSGHLEHQCNSYRGSHFVSTPFIMDYSDIYGRNEKHDELRKLKDKRESLERLRKEKMLILQRELAEQNEKKREEVKALQRNMSKKPISEAEMRRIHEEERRLDEEEIKQEEDQMVEEERLKFERIRMENERNRMMWSNISAPATITNDQQVLQTHYVPPLLDSNLLNAQSRHLLFNETNIAVVNTDFNQFNQQNFNNQQMNNQPVVINQQHFTNPLKMHNLWQNPNAQNLDRNYYDQNINSNFNQHNFIQNNFEQQNFYQLDINPQNFDQQTSPKISGQENSQKPHIIDVNHIDSHLFTKSHIGGQLIAKWERECKVPILYDNNTVQIFSSNNSIINEVKARLGKLLASHRTNLRIYSQVSGKLSRFMTYTQSKKNPQILFKQLQNPGNVSCIYYELNGILFGKYGLENGKKHMKVLNQWTKKLVNFYPLNMVEKGVIAKSMNFVFIKRRTFAQYKALIPQATTLMRQTNFLSLEVPGPSGTTSNIVSNPPPAPKIAEEIINMKLFLTHREAMYLLQTQDGTKLVTKLKQHIEVEIVFSESRGNKCGFIILKGVKQKVLQAKQNVISFIKNLNDTNTHIFPLTSVQVYKQIVTYLAKTHVLSYTTDCSDLYSKILNFEDNLRETPKSGELLSQLKMHFVKLHSLLFVKYKVLDGAKHLATLTHWKNNLSTSDDRLPKPILDEIKNAFFYIFDSNRKDIDYNNILRTVPFEMISRNITPKKEEEINGRLKQLKALCYEKRLDEKLKQLMFLEKHLIKTKHSRLSMQQALCFLIDFENSVKTC